MKTVESYNFKDKKVLIRVDFNVPLNHNRQITDDTRIKESIPTIKKVLDDGASVILMSHLGRPKGGFENDYSLTPIVPILSKLLNKDIIFTRDLFSEKTKVVCSQLKPGDVVMLENLRFYPEEENADEAFAKDLASLGDYYVNDAFATSHRYHTSTAVITKFFPQKKFFGLLMANELTNLNKILFNPISPFTAIIAGAKVSTKINILENLLNKVNNLIIGGGMSYTFIKALGGNVGKSMIEEDKIDFAKKIIHEAMLKGINLYLPVDIVMTESFSNEAPRTVFPINKIKNNMMGMDIGPETCRRFAEILKTSSTILWNGPVGVYEMPNFEKGTKSIAIAVASATIGGAFSLIGGGDSVAAINKFNLADQISYVSTGGGALLEYLEGKELPGVKALLD